MGRIQKLVFELGSNDKNIQGDAYRSLMEMTNVPVSFTYEIWDSLTDLLENGNNTGRSAAAQLLVNLAKSDPENRIDLVLDKLFKATKDEKFVTARHSLLALWKVGIVNEQLLNKVLDGLQKRFYECKNEKNCTLIRYDIVVVHRKMYDQLLNQKVIETSMNLISFETDFKYQKKYLTVWKDIMQSD